MPDDVVIERIDNVSRYRRKSDLPVWHCCRNCNADIPASAPNHAYCDAWCKAEAASHEMGVEQTRDDQT